VDTSATAPLEPALPGDARSIAELLTSTALQLTTKYGFGQWSRPSTIRAVMNAMRTSRVFVVRQDHAVVATLGLAPVKPWAIDLPCFTPSARPIYLISMAVTPPLQRHGLGRQCVEHALQIAREGRADAVRLDAYDADAGAGDFYVACGFRRAGRAVYRSIPLLYFERVLA